MTSLVALATKDALIFGCDSLGTTTKDFIDPADILEFFDSDKNFEIKKDSNGNPILKDFSQLYAKSIDLPYTHMTHITKVFPLTPLEMAIMFTGIAAIGDRTIKSIIEEFISKDPAFKTKPKAKNYSVKGIARKILSFVCEFYDKEYSDEKRKPDLELIIGGYDKQNQIPKVFRIKLPSEDISESVSLGTFGLVFGGQMKEIQRIVFGTDGLNRNKIYKRHIELIREYRNNLNDFLKQSGAKFVVPELSMEDIKNQDMFKDGWDLEGFSANWGDFSEQNAIECVDFFVNIMIKSQQFNSGMPTVGGEVHILLITKSGGCRFVSREEYYHEGHYVPKASYNKLESR